MHPPLSSLHGLVPVLQGQLEFHLLHEGGQEALEVDHHLVDQVQGPAVVVALLKELGFPKQCVDVAGPVPVKSQKRFAVKLCSDYFDSQRLPNTEEEKDSQSEAYSHIKRLCKIK